MLAKRSSARRPHWVGVIHLPPLPGSPGAYRLKGGTAQAIEAAGSLAVRESVQLAKAGASAIILENFGDVPFFGASAPAETIAAMTLIGAAVKESVRIPLGINILRNDSIGAFKVAAVIGADFVRANVLVGVSATDQGLLNGNAAELARLRATLAPEIAIWADVQVKHAVSLSHPHDDEESLQVALEDTGHRGGADVAIVTGSTTGRGVDPEYLKRAIRAAKRIGLPLAIGSGITPESFRALKGSEVHACIVGSALRKGGRAGHPLETKRLQAFQKLR